MLYLYMLDFREPGFKHLARISNYTMLFIIERNISISFTQPCILQVSHTIGKKDKGSLVCFVHNGYLFALDNFLDLY